MVDEPKLCSWCKQPIINPQENQYLHHDCAMDADAELRSMYDDGESSWEWYHNR